MSLRAIRGVRLIDGTGREPVPNAGVLVDRGTIIAAGPDATLSAPPGTPTVDGRGLTLLPGLIDCHVHMMIQGVDMLRRVSTSPSFGVLQCIPHLHATLHAGFTTVRDAAGAPLGVKQAVERGIVPGPRMEISVTMLSQTGGHGDSWTRACVHVPLFGRHPDVPDGIADGVDEVRRKTREILRAGADWIKLCTTGGVVSQTDGPSAAQYTVEEIAAAVYEADAAGARGVMAHAQGTRGIKNAIRAGVTSIEHGVYLDEEAIEMMRARGVFLVPTLVAPVQILREAEREPGSMPPWAVEKTRQVIGIHHNSFRLAAEAGVPIAMGTDAGLSTHGENAEEIALMVRNGMDPMEALRATTSRAAELLKMQDRVGTVEPGKLADLILVDGDPLADITVLQDRSRIVLVMRDGTVFKDLTGEPAARLGASLELERQI